MSEKYKYWNVELQEKCCILKLVEIENIDKSIEESKTAMREHEKKMNELKESRDKAENEKDRTNYTNDYLVESSNYQKAKAKAYKMEDMDKVYKRNRGRSFKIQRLKDLYSRKESVAVVILDNGVEDGKIMSATGKIGEDIYKLEEYGIYLTAPYLDELAKIIRDIYFDITVKEQEFIDNDVPLKAVEAFLQLCNQQIKENEMDEDKGYYNIPVATFKEWYENSNFKRFTLTSIKEALIIHQYAKANKGRNDYTVSGIGKVVRLNVAKCKEIGIAKEDEK